MNNNEKKELIKILLEKTLADSVFDDRHVAQIKLNNILNAMQKEGIITECVFSICVDKTKTNANVRVQLPNNQTEVFNIEVTRKSVDFSETLRSSRVRTLKQMSLMIECMLISETAGRYEENEPALISDLADIKYFLKKLEKTTVKYSDEK